MSFENNGFELINNFINDEQLKNICDEIKPTSLSQNSGGIRNAEKKFQSVKTLALSKQLFNKASNYLSNKPHLVRAFLFDKTPENNWLVTWHQDKTVSVSEKFDMDDWGPWSVKENIQHVQPPIDVLNKMVSFRIHLDDTTLENGCLKVIPKTHLLGIVDKATILELTKKEDIVICEAMAGAALVMRPHLIHSSSKATTPSKRRVLHLEYCCYELPEGIFWA